MIRKITLLLSLALFASFGFAQVEFSKDSAELIYVDMTNFEYAEEVEITNNSTDPADTVFTWERTVEAIPDEWGTAICDKDLCYPESTNTAGFILPIGKTIKFKVNYYPYNARGCGDVTITIFSDLNPTTNNDTFYTEVCAFNPASVKEVHQSFKIYPNPAKDYITIQTQNQGALNYGIYDILGNLHQSDVVLSGGQIDIHNLKKGVYVLRLEGDHSRSQVFHKL